MSTSTGDEFRVNKLVETKKYLSFHPYIHFKTVEMSTKIGDSDISYDIVDFDDGHKPGKTELPTKIAMHEGKNMSAFLSVFDDVLPLQWCHRAYDYAIQKGRLVFLSICTIAAIHNATTLMDNLIMKFI